MNKTQVSSGWKFFIFGECAVAALCGAAILAFVFVSAWTTQSVEQPVYSAPQQSYESVPQQEPASAVSDILTGHRWKVHSPTLGTDVILEADFKDGGSFDGIITSPLAKFCPLLNR